MARYAPPYSWNSSELRAERPPLPMIPRTPALAAPALHIERHRIHCNVGPGLLDVHGQRRGVPAKPLWSDARFVDRRQEVALELCQLGVRIGLANRTSSGLLGQLDAQV